MFAQQANVDTAVFGASTSKDVMLLLGGQGCHCRNALDSKVDGATHDVDTCR